jgi:short subunit dehydrogenase-like uncharacterized protein
VPRTGRWAIYGAYGYTGELITRMAAEQGLKPILAGRREDALRPLADKHGLEVAAVSLEDSPGLRALLERVDVVAHCAGPFKYTARPMLEACLATGTHYLDITGEIEIFEACARMGAEAAEAGVMLLPGVGFDVVPTDCLAARLKARMPEAVSLTLAIYGSGGGLSHGTASTVIANLDRPGAIRQEGKIVQVERAHALREIDFGTGPRQCVAIPWGDVSTAFHSTGIPDIVTFASFPRKLIKNMQRKGALTNWVVTLGLTRKLAQAWVDRNLHGPTDAQREAGRSRCWGEVLDAQGNAAVSRLVGPEGYTLTAMTTLAAVRRVLDGQARPGFQTPSRAFGADFVLDAPGVSFEDL